MGSSKYTNGEWLFRPPFIGTNQTPAALLEMNPNTKTSTGYELDVVLSNKPENGSIYTLKS